MLNVNVDHIGDLAILECDGRIVQSEAAFKLREVITSQRDARTVVLRPLPSGCHRRRRSWHARISAAMGSGPRYSIQTVQSAQVCAGKAQEGPLDVEVRHSNPR